VTARLLTDQGRGNPFLTEVAADKKEQLGFDRPSEQAFMAAGEAMVDNADLLLAVWDGAPAAGLGELEMLSSTPQL
jgi:hypothetical protein